MLVNEDLPVILQWEDCITLPWKDQQPKRIVWSGSSNHDAVMKRTETLWSILQNKTSPQVLGSGIHGMRGNIHTRFLTGKAKQYDEKQLASPLRPDVAWFQK
jgi:hypothetical protein